MIEPPRNKKLKLSVEDGDDHKVHGECLPLEDLPRDVILAILIRLPISSLIQFRLVCKSWKLLSIDPDLSRLHHSALANDDPTLLFHCDYPIRNHLSFVELSSSGCDGDGDGDGDGKIVRKIYTPFSGSMPEFNVVGSCNGLLCLSDSLYVEPVFLFNPFSMDYLELPKSKQFQEQEVLFGFGFHPVTNEYKVVKIVYYRNWQVRRRIIRNNRNYPKSEVQILTISKQTNKSSWRCLGKVPYHLDRQATEAPVVNGRIHWVSRPGRIAGVPGRAIISFDLKDEQFKVVAKPGHAIVNRGNYHLAVIKGCLAAVISCGYGKLEIWVMKEYDSKESWMKEFVIHGAFPAKMPSHEQHHYGIWRWPLGGRMVRVLCVLKNGDILLEYRGGSLVKYDPKWKEFKDVVFPRMPKLFQTIVHVGTLNWVHT
ncbi:F-box protein At3g07870-like [Cynara cardunculus var. scolymus]|uniref:F-box domain-containing protein n=1 Tax=Cynara cardunculus var. scolymus TaxID=59895 RepID=A0A103YKC0_CYNCS|nr:F-box protein At3g07870-like [Cynara cardunculus var. scolymus]KVI10630.1 hypothetical protein Ccrd_010969 [Cynara cardunculus var. scolymus]